jgi:hypothetical protein
MSLNCTAEEMFSEKGHATISKGLALFSFLAKTSIEGCMRGREDGKPGAFNPLDTHKP